MAMPAIEMTEIREMSLEFFLDPVNLFAMKKETDIKNSRQNALFFYEILLN